VAEIEGVVAGFASYTEAGYVDFLFTHPNFALYHRVGSALLNRVVNTVTMHAGLAARSFFDHDGVQLDAEESVQCRGTQLRRFAMHKSLDNGR
jgi:hypothetical protein